MNVFRALRGHVLAVLAIAALGLLVQIIIPTRMSIHAGQAASASAAPRSRKVVLYAAIGPVLTQYDVDVEAATLTKRGSVTLPASVTEAAFHPSKKYLYVVWGYTTDTAVNGKHKHGINAFRIDPATGALIPHGQPVSLPPSPGYISYATTDIPGTHVLVSDTDPSHLAVYRIEPDGTLGSEVKSTATLDFGLHAHQVRVDPSNKTVILITRGTGPTADKPEDPGALKLFSYNNNGQLANRETIAPNGGFNYQARHLDFHPTKPWDFVTLERQNKLLVYQRMSDGTLGTTPLFSKDSLADPGNVRSGQILGTVHVHPNGKFVYVGNRASDTVDFQGKPVFAGGENNIAVFAINQNTGEPTKIQNIDTQGMHPRTFVLDPRGKLLVAGNILQLSVRDGQSVREVPAGLTVFRVGGDGKLAFVHKYDADVKNSQLFWVGVTALP